MQFFTSEDTWCQELTHWKRSWCWERSRAGGEVGGKGWDSWMASLTQWTQVWENSGKWWRTRKPGVLQSMGLQSGTQISDWIKTAAKARLRSKNLKKLSTTKLALWQMLKEYLQVKQKRQQVEIRNYKMKNFTRKGKHIQRRKLSMHKYSTEDKIHK